GDDADLHGLALTGSARRTPCAARRCCTAWVEAAAPPAGSTVDAPTSFGPPITCNCIERSNVFQSASFMPVSGTTWMAPAGTWADSWLRVGDAGCGGAFARKLPPV